MWACDNRPDEPLDGIGTNSFPIMVDNTDDAIAAVLKAAGSVKRHVTFVVNSKSEDGNELEIFTATINRTKLTARKTSVSGKLPFLLRMVQPWTW